MSGPKVHLPGNESRDGDTARLDLWFARDAQWLHGLLRRNLRMAPSEADDLVQDTWVRLLRRPPAQVSHPRALLSRIALNLFRDRRRAERVRVDKSHLIAANDAVVQPPPALREQEVDFLLEQLILDLPEPVRDVFMLSRFRRMTNHDIAEHMGISVKTVEWRIGKAMELCLTKLQG